MVIQSSVPLITGERMSADEFMRRWDDLPDLKSAELIDGVVHIPAIVIPDQGRVWSSLIGCFASYAWRTPGCEAGSKATWLMLESVPQPDAFLLILPEHSGQARVEGNYWRVPQSSSRKSVSPEPRLISGPS
jgi:hypothetical protein